MRVNVLENAHPVYTQAEVVLNLSAIPTSVRSAIHRVCMRGVCKIETLTAAGTGEQIRTKIHRIILVHVAYA